MIDVGTVRTYVGEREIRKEKENHYRCNARVMTIRVLDTRRQKNEKGLAERTVLVSASRCWQTSIIVRGFLNIKRSTFIYYIKNIIVDKCDFS